VILAAVTLLAPSAATARFVFVPPNTGLVSPPTGPPADGPSDNTAFSQDDRDSRLLAYDSAADNLVAGDANGHRDVFVLRRTLALRSVSGRLSLVSVSSSGRQANGDSSHPSIDGTTGAVPHCIAFQSTATNLDPHDRSPDSDVYVRDLRSHRTTLVSVGITGATGASIDGRCRYVVFEATGVVYDADLATQRVLRVGAGARPEQQTDGRGLVYQHGGQIWYERISIGRGGPTRRWAPRLVSTAAAGGPAAGISENPSVDDHGRYVAFDSTATDLCTLVRCGWNYHPAPNWRKLDPGATPEGMDANGPVSDVFRADLALRPSAPTAMLLVSYDYDYNQLEGPSVDPQISRAGQGIVFTSGQTTSPGLALASSTQNVFSWSDASQKRGDGHLRVWSAGWSCAGLPCHVFPFNGPSLNPSMSSRGNYIAFTSAATGVVGEANGAAIPDVFLQFTTGAPLRNRR
jgi:hypothetical protein